MKQVDGTHSANKGYQSKNNTVTGLSDNSGTDGPHPEPAYTGDFPDKK